MDPRKLVVGAVLSTLSALLLVPIALEAFEPGKASREDFRGQAFNPPFVIRGGGITREDFEVLRSPAPNRISAILTRCEPGQPQQFEASVASSLTERGIEDLLKPMPVEKNPALATYIAFRGTEEHADVLRLTNPGPLPARNKESVVELRQLPTRAAGQVALLRELAPVVNVPCARLDGPALPLSESFMLVGAPERLATLWSKALEANSVVDSGSIGEWQATIRPQAMRLTRSFGSDQKAAEREFEELRNRLASLPVAAAAQFARGMVIGRGVAYSFPDGRLDLSAGDEAGVAKVSLVWRQKR